MISRMRHEGAFAWAAENFRASSWNTPVWELPHHRPIQVSWTRFLLAGEGISGPGDGPRQPSPESGVDEHGKWGGDDVVQVIEISAAGKMAGFCPSLALVGRIRYLGHVLGMKGVEPEATPF